MKSVSSFSSIDINGTKFCTYFTLTLTQTTVKHIKNVNKQACMKKIVHPGRYRFTRR